MKAGSRKIKSIKKRLRTRAISRKIAGGRRSRRRFSKKRSFLSLSGGVSPDDEEEDFTSFPSENQGGRRRRGQRGGYSQYQNNWPSTGVFSVGSPNLPPNLLALANPPPITKLSNCVNCVDNYNHYTNMGFPSKGH